MWHLVCKTTSLFQTFFSEGLAQPTVTAESKSAEQKMKIVLAAEAVKQYCIEINILRTRMWANAQPDGRPAEQRWRALFNAA